MKYVLKQHIQSTSSRGTQYGNRDIHQVYKAMCIMDWRRQIETAQINEIKVLSQKVNNKSLVYLDSAATSLTPEMVISSMNEYYQYYNANIHRGVHKLSEVATEKYEEAHKKLAKFINAEEKEIIFTSGTTHSLNLLAYSLTSSLDKGDEIILTEMEHHSNLVPWHQLAKQKGLVLKYIKVTAGGPLDL